MALIIVADAHIQPDSIRERAFFRMLSKLGNSRYDVVFLGDIFELWVALPGYEGTSQGAFLKWCRRQKSRRNIGFVEGNHEFFVSAEHGDSFSWSTAGPYWRDARDNLYVHGDQINRGDRRYRLFRRLTKNHLTKTLLRFLPGGAHICDRLDRTLGQTNPDHRRGLPETEIAHFAGRMFADGIKKIFVGHFHSTHRYENPSGQILFLLPAWFETGEVTRVDTNNAQKPVEFINWEALPG